MTWDVVEVKVAVGVVKVVVAKVASENEYFLIEPCHGLFDF